MTRLIAAVALFGTLLVGSVAQAQQAGGEVGQTTTYNFEDDIVTGDLVRPDGELAVARARGLLEEMVHAHP